MDIPKLLTKIITNYNEKFSNYDELPEHIIDMFIKQNVSCSSYDVDKKCKRVLKYLFPDYETELNITRYENAMNALRSIAK